ncbi:ATP-binding protein [Xanthomonas sp. NCPPB 3005]|uniref:ATP-binding protein n=1 Tax=Xanthomonas sp. NCPPB 3005 TaxID=3240913 RepID=UPI003513727F
MRWPRWRRAAAAAPQPADARYSLRRRLIATTLGSSIACWLVSLAVIVGVAWTETSDVFDDALEESARLVATFGPGLLHGAAPAEDGDAAADTDGGVRLYYQIVDRHGTVLRRSADVPRQPFVPPGQVHDDDITISVRHAQRLWRVHVLHARAQDLYVEVAQPLEERTELLEDMAENLVWPALALLVLLAALNWWVIRRQLRPLERLAEDIGRQSPQALNAVSAAGQADELRPIVQALNGVLARLGEALQSERRFTADAAHELRTPLAGLRMKIQLMQRSHAATLDPAQRQDLATLRADVDRATALVDNLLMLARLDPQQPGSLACTAVALPALVDAVLADIAPAASAKRIGLHVDIGVDTVWAHGELLRSALRNLLDNAVRYGRAEGQVRIDATAVRGATGAPSAVRIVVRDDGPGVAPGDLPRLTQRFFRVLGNAGQGSGLGLSLVERIVALHGGQLRLDSGGEGMGLAVRIELPQRASPAAG